MCVSNKVVLSLLLCGVVALHAAPGVLLAADEESAADTLQHLLDDAWEFELREDPLWATHVGEHRFNARLPEVTVADEARRWANRVEFLERIKDIDRQQLSAAERVNYDIFKRLTNDTIREYEFRTYLMPITNRSGFHISFPELAKRMPLNTVADYENYIARLNAFSRYADQHITVMRKGIERGMVLPAVVLEGAADAIAPHIVDDPAKSLLYAPFQAYPERIAADEQKRLTAAGRRAILQSVAPGFRRFADFMRREYLATARGSVGASALPQGRAFYRHRVRKFTTLDLSPEQVHQTGLEEVARIHAEMLQVIKQVKFDGDFAAFVKHLREGEEFYPKSAEQLMKEVSFVLKKMDGELPRLFRKLPRAPYGIRRVPDYIAPRTTTAYYMQPAGDGSRAGFYYVNTYNLKSRPLFEIEALSLHEAVPGHHLQLALQQEMRDLPDFRRYAGFTAFVEGWALYAERLGLEVGFYQDPYANFGRLSYEMWRACRLVVDTGLHYLGWSREQAIQYMAENTALSLHNITAEVDRYISWPGQALAYKTGELKIRALRATAEEKLGGRFDVRQFHDVVLGGGSVPLSVLEDNVHRYIAEESSNAP